MKRGRKMNRTVVGMIIVVATLAGSTGCDRRGNNNSNSSNDLYTAAAILNTVDSGLGLGATVASLFSW